MNLLEMTSRSRSNEASRVFSSISSSKMQAKPQYSGSSVVSPFTLLTILSVTFVTNFINLGLGFLSPLCAGMYFFEISGILVIVLCGFDLCCMWLCLPYCYLLLQPLCELVYAFACFGAYRNDLGCRIAFMDVFLTFFHIEIEIRKDVDLVDEDKVAD